MKGNRPFFSEEYALKLIDVARLKMKHIEMGEEQIYDRQSGFIKVTATKQPTD